MSEELVKYSENISLKTLIDFQMLLNDTPKDKQIKINGLARNSKYLPINYIEKLLDEHYTGLWQVHSFNYKVVANEIIGDLTLEVFNPAAKIWIKRIGTGSVQIMTKKDTNAMEISNKIQNCLIMLMPKLKAECIKNAAKSLGVVFGRNLNRDDDNSFEDLTEKIENFEEKQQEKTYREQILKEAFDLIKIDNSIKDKEKAFTKLSGLQNDKIENYIKFQQNGN